MNDEVLREKLSQLDIPGREAIAGWKIEIGQDSTGELAVWVFVIVRDALIESFGDSWRDARWQIKAAVAEAMPRATFTYIRLQTESERTTASVVNG